MAEVVPMKVKKNAGKRTEMEREAVSKTFNALLKAVVKVYLWKCRLEEGKHASVRELSTIVNISMRCVQQIIRLNYLAHKIVHDIMKGRQPSGFMLVHLREIPMFWSEQLDKF